MKRLALALLFLSGVSSVEAQQKTPNNVNGCLYVSSLPTLTNGQTTVLHCDANGKLYVNGVNATQIVPGTTTISPKTNGGVLYDNNGVVGDSTTLPSGLTIPSPTLSAPALGTPASGVATNLTGTAPGLTAGAVTNLTLGGATTFSGAYTFTGTLTANTSVTFPISGTLATNGALAYAQDYPSSNPTGSNTATAGGVMMGLGSAMSMTPAVTGRVALSFTANGACTTATGGAKVFLHWGTGTAPTNGTAFTGSGPKDLGRLFIDATTSSYPSISDQSIITGLTVGTAYWFDVAVQTLGGVYTCSTDNIAFTAQEF